MSDTTRLDNHLHDWIARRGASIPDTPPRIGGYRSGEEPSAGGTAAMIPGGAVSERGWQVLLSWHGAPSNVEREQRRKRVRSRK